MRRSTAMLVISVLLVAAHALAGVPQDDLEEYGRGIIADYSDMQQGEDIQWYWIRPGMRLGEHRCELGSAQNLSQSSDRGLRDVLKEDLPDMLEHACARAADAPVLAVDAAVYWAQRANTSKAWIPFAGGHLMQAGVGIELVFKNADGEIVAKIRQSGREGSELASAAAEVLDDFSSFLRAN